MQELIYHAQTGCAAGGARNARNAEQARDAELAEHAEHAEHIDYAEHAEHAKDAGNAKKVEKDEEYKNENRDSEGKTRLKDTLVVKTLPATAKDAYFVVIETFLALT